MMTTIKRLVEIYSYVVKLITFDSGSEFVKQFKSGLIEDTFDCKINYANPCAPHERESNNFKNISQSKIDQAVQSMNLRLRKFLNGNHCSISQI